jgi:hypothetical protein
MSGIARALSRNDTDFHSPASRARTIASARVAT